MGLRFSRLGHHTDIAAGTEGRVTGAGDDGDPQLVVRLELVDGRGHFMAGGGADGVHDVGAIDGEDEQTPLPFGGDVLVTH